jgi:hypothetical protein
VLLLHLDEDFPPGLILHEPHRAHQIRLAGETGMRHHEHRSRAQVVARSDRTDEVLGVRRGPQHVCRIDDRLDVGADHRAQRCRMRPIE